MIEPKIRKIWSQELELTDFNNDDDFFALGGHSLIMAKIQQDIAEQFGIEVPMDELFRRPTVASISAHLDSQMAKA